MPIERLADLIREGISSSASRDQVSEQTRLAVEGLFGERYRANSSRALRIALPPSSDAISFAGLVHEDSPTSGVFGGMSLTWFPVVGTEDRAAATLLTFVCGTRGLAPDEQILGRPGHVRHLQAMKRYLYQQHNIAMWVKHDPTNLAEPFPRVMEGQLSSFSRVLDRYGNYIYAAVEVPQASKHARAVVAAFVDFYAWERGWVPLKKAVEETDIFKLTLRSHLFPKITEQAVYSLLRERRFVILQGPPGTGKTRLATLLLNRQFSGQGTAIQFHPAVTYETFVAGISPDVEQSALRFGIKGGFLVEATYAARDGDYLLIIDEVNRADLGRVLGEAIFLFEPREISQQQGRSIKLPVRLEDGEDSLSIPPGLFVLGTMNSADRSIAILDLAVRRRFAFVDLWPDMEVVARQGQGLATEAFGRLLDIFTQFAPDDALVLVPGHAYFLAESESELARRLKYELVPLLREYLQDGRLGSCESELYAYLDWLETQVG